MVILTHHIAVARWGLTTKLTGAPLFGASVWSAGLGTVGTGDCSFIFQTAYSCC